MKSLTVLADESATIARDLYEQRKCQAALVAAARAVIADCQWKGDVAEVAVVPIRELELALDQLEAT